MKLKTIVLYICALSVILSLTLCGCSKDDEQTTNDNGLGTYTPPFYGTEGTPEEDGIIMGEGDEEQTPPSLTAP